METSNSSWLDRAGDFADRKMKDQGQFQGLALLAIAEAIHRLSAAVEKRNTQRPDA